MPLNCPDALILSGPKSGSRSTCLLLSIVTATCASSNSAVVPATGLRGVWFTKTETVGGQIYNASADLRYIYPETAVVERARDPNVIMIIALRGASFRGLPGFCRPPADTLDARMARLRHSDKIRIHERKSKNSASSNSFSARGESASSLLSRIDAKTLPRERQNCREAMTQNHGPGTKSLTAGLPQEG